jgi:hypothetical protein
MSNSKAAAKPRSVRRLTRDSTGVVTINVRASRILLVWASHDSQAPIERGWYLHAASVEGRESTVDGERRLDAPFDLQDPQVRWQHARIDRLGGADLFLAKDRRYVFYVTKDPANRDDLLRDHLPWPCYLYPPQSKGLPAILALQVWPLQLCYHGPEEGDISPKGAPKDSSLVAFDSWEHESIAEAPAWGGESVQEMVDMWAFRGLLDGGAMIDTRGSFEDWNFFCPGETASATPLNPYSLPQPIMVSDPRDATWNYVIPQSQVDPQTKTASPWTASALKEAMRAGRAAALSVGQIIMLAGDDFGTPEEMETDSNRWKNPTNVMRLYWEARNWLEARKKVLANKPDEYAWEDYRQRYGAVYLMFGLLLASPDELQKQETVDNIQAVGKGEPEDDTEELESKADPDWSSVHKKYLKYWFDRFCDRARKVDAMVDYLQAASGPSVFTQIQFTAQTLITAAKGKGGTLGWIQSRLPWLKDRDPRSDFTNAGFKNEEIQWFETDGINEQLMQIVSSNGRYGDLGLGNWTHFSEGGMNFQMFERYHRPALALVEKHATAGDSSHPIPARALFLTAFGCHFFTDAFASGHMRVPRQELGAFSAKLMHDVDGLVGLWVYTEHDPKHPWYAFGDTYLHPRTVTQKQWKLPESAGGNSAQVGANFQRVAEAVGAAFKQLHYQAHSLRQTEPKPPLMSSLNATVQLLLDANGPAYAAEFPVYRRSRLALQDILKSNPPLPDLTKATHLLNELLAPGCAGPKGQGYVWDHLRMSTGQRILYLKSLVPIPLPVAVKAPKYVADGPASPQDPANIPPLFDKHGNLIYVDGENPYDIVTSEGNKLRGFTHYAGFSLRVKWGPFKDSWNDDEELRLNFDKYYFMTKFFTGVQGLEFLMDKSLLKVYDTLPHDLQ